MKSHCMMPEGSNPRFGAVTLLFRLSVASDLRPHSIEESVFIDQSIPFIFSVVGADTVAVGVVFQVNRAPRLSAAFPLREFVSADNTNALHCSAIAFAIP